MDEICRSNIMQRDNKKFARKLDKSLAKLAKEKNKTVSYLLVALKLTNRTVLGFWNINGKHCLQANLNRFIYTYTQSTEYNFKRFGCCL